MDQVTKRALARTRKILGDLGIRHTVGTSTDDHGDTVVVVDVPREVDRRTVRNELRDVGTNVVIRNVVRSIIAH